MKPIYTGLALSITAMVFYSLCTFAEVMWPAKVMEFMNALFHGLNFRRLSASENALAARSPVQPRLPSTSGFVDPAIP